MASIWALAVVLYKYPSLRSLKRLCQLRAGINNEPNGAHAVERTNPITNANHMSTYIAKLFVHNTDMLFIHLCICDYAIEIIGDSS